MLKSHAALRFLVLGVVALLVSAMGASAAPRVLSAEIQAERATLGASDDVYVRFTLHNESSQDLYVLSWQTPLRGVEENIFDVRRDGQPVDYIGRLYKWATPRPEDFIRIPAGRSVSARVELSSVYDISRSGEYSIQYRVPVREALRATGAEVAAAKLGNIESNVVGLSIERDERLAVQAPVEAPAPGLIVDGYRTPSFVSCSSSRQSSLITALGNAQTISQKARDYLNNVPTTSRPTNTAYRTWFGSYTSSRYSTVTSHYSNIYNSFVNQTYTFNCSCTSSAYAYVYANQPYRVYLCNAFWNAPSLGIDSKAGTLVHESSHFTVNGGTQDYAYGTSAAQSLANSSPSQAVMNADNHEYFAETR
jgi:peptidyl-Lys metalloendopeptidase